MTKNTRPLTMKHRLLAWLKTHHHVDEILCYHPNCRQPILVGQEIVSKDGGSRRHYYHRACYEGTFH